MSEWWTYRPGDFLMFSPRAYARLFELVNAAWWPLHVLILMLGLAGLTALARGRGPMPLAAGLAAAWMLSTWVFVNGLYKDINWAVGYLLPGLALLAALLPLLAWHTRHAVPRNGIARRCALGLFAWALLLHPLMASLAGGGWRQSEVIALAPDPTAIATLALLLVLPRQPAPLWRGLDVLAWLLALAWCAFSGFMLVAMASWNALVLLGAAGLALWVRGCSTRQASI